MSYNKKRNASSIKYNHGYKNTHNYKQSSERSQRYWLWLFTHYDAHLKYSVECHVCRHLISIISVINQLDVQNFCFTISLFHASRWFEHMYSSSLGKNCIEQQLVSSNVYVAVSCTRRPHIGLMIPEAM